MKKIYRLTLLLVVYAWLFASCGTVHEFPEEKLTGPVELAISFDEDRNNLAEYVTVSYKSPSTKAFSADGQVCVRHIVEIYDANNNLVFREYAVRPEIGNQDVKFTTELAYGQQYHAYAWIDYVIEGLHNDMFYVTSSLRTIKVNMEEYPVSTDLKEVFAGGVDFVPDVADADADGVISHTIDVHRPVAKLRVVTTDIDKYFASHGKLPARISFSYEQSLPVLFDPHKSIGSVYMDCLTIDEEVGEIIGSECTLVYDWVFALAQETEVKVWFEIFDENDKMIVHSPTIKAPLVANKMTTIRDAFLTTNFGGGIGIDDGFEGEIEIEL